MSYDVHNFKSGDKLYAYQLNEMDEAIKRNEDDSGELKSHLSLLMSETRFTSRERWEQGGFDFVSGASKTSATNRIRTDFIEGISRVECKSIFVINAWAFSSDGEFIGGIKQNYDVEESDASLMHNFIIFDFDEFKAKHKGLKIKLTGKRTDNEYLDPEWYENFTFIKKVAKKSYHAVNAKEIIKWELGSFYGDTGKEMESSTRMRNVGFLDLSKVDFTHIKLNEGYKATYCFYDNNDNFMKINGAVSWHEGEVFMNDFDGASKLRIAIAKTDDSALTDNMIGLYSENVVIDFGLEEERYAKYVDIREKLYASGMNDVFSATKYKASSLEATRKASENVYVHITDLHGDKKRFEFAVDLAEKIKAKAILCSGDMVSYYATDDISFMYERMKKSTVALLPCIGNHDNYLMSHVDVYNKFIKPFMGVSSANIICQEGKTYYYADIKERNTRVIALNMFETEGANPDMSYCYQQEQIDWLIQTLNTLPNGIKPIVMMHSLETEPVNNIASNKFYQGFIEFADYPEITPIKDIIDAYISKTSITKAYAQTKKPNNLIVNADFTGRVGGDFMFFVSGHEHADIVHYAPNSTNKMLVLNATCTNAWKCRNRNGSYGYDYPYYTELSDLAREEGTPTENAVNVYVFDGVESKVNIVRVGSRIPYNLENVRDYMRVETK